MNSKCITNWLGFMILFLFISVVSFAQQQKIKYRKTASGLEYALIKKGAGEKLKNGYRVYINYSLYIKPDSVYDSNIERNEPYSFLLGQEDVLKGWDEGIALLNVGDSAHFRIPPQLAYGSRKIGSIPANSTLLLHVKVIRTEQAFYDLKGKDTLTFSSGLKKITIAKGNGEKAKRSYNATMQFTGYIFDTKGFPRVFQSSLTNSTLAIFQIGSGRMIKGLDEGVATMSIGEKATFIVPPALGFGDKVSGVVPANSTLYYDIELLGCDDPFFHSKRKDTLITPLGVKILFADDITPPPAAITNRTQPRDGAITMADVVTFDYTGYIIDSLGYPVIFENTLERKFPTTIRPGSHRALPGIEEALMYLKKGERAILYVPPTNGFAKNKALIFDVTIVDIHPYPFFETSAKDTVKLNSGLQYIPVRKGSGVIADTGLNVSVAYTGFCIDSTGVRKIFDASRESGKPLEFTLGENKIIKGFEEGITGMQPGEARTLIIPYTIGYGEKGMDNIGIPAKATLYFDVELLEVKKQK